MPMKRSLSRVTGRYFLPFFVMAVSLCLCCVLVCKLSSNFKLGSVIVHIKRLLDTTSMTK